MSLTVPISILQQGGIVALPTETVYGLVVDSKSLQAIQALYELKGRIADKPLPIVIADPGQVIEYTTELTYIARRLIARWWPGPLTLILPTSATVANALHARDSSIAVRCSSVQLIQSAVRSMGHALCLTSANLSDNPPMLTAQQVRDCFGEKVYVVQDDTVVQGTVSTIVDVRSEPYDLLREGAISAKMLEASLRDK